MAVCRVSHIQEADLASELGYMAWRPQPVMIVG